MNDGLKRLRSPACGAASPLSPGVSSGWCLRGWVCAGGFGVGWGPVGLGWRSPVGAGRGWVVVGYVGVRVASQVSRCSASRRVVVHGQVGSRSMMWRRIPVMRARCEDFGRGTGALPLTTCRQSPSSSSAGCSVVEGFEHGNKKHGDGHTERGCVHAI